MIIKRCDRCGKTYDPISKEGEHTNHQLKTTYEFYHKEKMNESIDLCPECAKEFANWMNKCREDNFFKW